MAGTKSDQQEGGDFPSLSLDPGVIGASTGGASQADLVRGFTDPELPANAGMPQMDDDDGDSMFHDSELPDLKPGFLGRAQGWER